MDLLAAFLGSAGEGPLLWLHGARSGSMLVTGEAIARHPGCAESGATSGRLAKSELFS